MKRIEFIAPVDAMRGNLSGNRTPLVYAPDNNPAWGCEDNVRSYALNYVPQFIGAKRSNGVKYFQVKTKSAVTMTNEMRDMCALLAIQASLSYAIRNEQSRLSDLLYIYNHSAQKQEGWTLNKFVQFYVRQGLANKAATFLFSAPQASGIQSIRYQNPFGSVFFGAVHVNIDVDLVAKFWFQLAYNPIEFAIAGMKGVAHQSDTWIQVIGSAYNVLNIKASEEIGGDTYVMIGNQYVQYIDTTDPESEADYEVVENEITENIDGVAYILTSTPPTP